MYRDERIKIKTTYFTFLCRADILGMLAKISTDTMIDAIKP